MNTRGPSYGPTFAHSQGNADNNSFSPSLSTLSLGLLATPLIHALTRFNVIVCLAAGAFTSTSRSLPDVGGHPAPTKLRAARS
jgi:hypothetical protein